MKKITIDDILENFNRIYEEDSKDSKKDDKKDKKDKKDSKEDEDVGGGLDTDDEEDPEKVEKELIEYFTEQGSEDPDSGSRPSRR